MIGGKRRVLFSGQHVFRSSDRIAVSPIFFSEGSQVPGNADNVAALKQNRAVK